MKKILVTGANGYLGSGVVRQLLDDGLEVIANDISDEFIDKRAQIFVGDIFGMDSPYEAMGCPEILLHMAWRDGFKHNSENHIIDLPKHFIFLRKMAAFGIKKMCVMGSMHEVGFYEGSIDESTPTNPLSLYGIAKDALRKVTYQLSHEYGFVYQWLRGYYIVGNSERGCSIFSKIVQASKREEKTFPFTTGENQFDFLDYGLFCRQVAAAVEQDEVNGIINCCSGVPMKLADRVEQFIKENNYDIKLKYGQFPDRPYDSKAVWGNNHKIELIMKRKRG